MKNREKLSICLFASQRYWSDYDELQNNVGIIKDEMSEIGADIQLILNEEDLEKLEGGDTIVTIPMSGAVQSMVIKAAERFDSVCIYPGYIKGNFSDDCRRKMLILNAAPAMMDIYSVLKRQRENVFMCLNRKSLTETLNPIGAYYKLKGSKLLLIGETEPWVISASRDLSVYKKKFGIDFVKIPIETMAEYYRDTKDKAAEDLYKFWKSGALDIVEPVDEDIMNASRFCLALEKLIEDHNAKGAAIACFDLLGKLKTTACLAVSYINNSTDYIAACEGDTDSAVTMLMVKALTKNGVWIANPNLQPDRSVNFVHCTAPLNISGKKCTYDLCNHHESGIGVSPRVDFPENLRVTACRVSDDAEKITILTGIGKRDIYEQSCRTQYRVEFDDFDKYIETVLGCHQTFAFEDISAQMKILAGMFKLKVL